MASLARGADLTHGLVGLFVGRMALSPSTPWFVRLDGGQSLRQGLSLAATLASRIAASYSWPWDKNDRGYGCRPTRTPARGAFSWNVADTRQPKNADDNSR